MKLRANETPISFHTQDLYPDYGCIHHILVTGNADLHKKLIAELKETYGDRASETLETTDPGCTEILILDDKTLDIVDLLSSFGYEVTCTE